MKRKLFALVILIFPLCNYAQNNPISLAEVEMFNRGEYLELLVLDNLDFPDQLVNLNNWIIDNHKIDAAIIQFRDNQVQLQFKLNGEEELTLADIPSGEYEFTLKDDQKYKLLLKVETELTTCEVKGISLGIINPPADFCYRGSPVEDFAMPNASEQEVNLGGDITYTLTVINGQGKILHEWQYIPKDKPSVMRFYGRRRAYFLKLTYLRGGGSVWDVEKGTFFNDSLTGIISS